MREGGEFERTEQELIESLRRFHESEPWFPTDPAEQRRRFNLLEIDPEYLNLRESYYQATGDARLNLFLKVRDRRWKILTSPNPEQLIAQVQDQQNL